MFNQDRVSPSHAATEASTYQPASNPPVAAYNQMTWNRNYPTNDYWSSINYQNRHPTFSANQAQAYRPSNEAVQQMTTGYLPDSGYASYLPQGYAQHPHQSTHYHHLPALPFAGHSVVNEARHPLREVKPTLEPVEPSCNAPFNESIKFNDGNNENTEDAKSENDTQSPTSFASSYPAYFTTQKIVNNTAKLSYTDYQLEILNAIYNEMRYPNADQKTKIAELFRISREQVKIWFQNRRRKDTLVSQGKMPASAINAGSGAGRFNGNKRRRSDSENDDNDNSQSSLENQPPLMGEKKSVVDPGLIEQILDYLRSLKDAPSRLSTKRTKLSPPTEPSETLTAKGFAAIDLSILCQNREKMITIHHNKPVIDIPPAALVQPKREKTEPAQSCSNTSSSASSSSLLMIPSSSSASSSSATSTSGSSSSCDEEVVASSSSPYAAAQAPPSFQVLQNPVSIQEYLGSRIMPNFQFKFHNHINNYRPPATTEYQNVTPPPSQSLAVTGITGQWPQLAKMSYLQPPAPISNDTVHHDETTQSIYKPPAQPVYQAHHHMPMFNPVSYDQQTESLDSHHAQASYYYPSQQQQMQPSYSSQQSHIDYQSSSSYDPAYKASLCSNPLAYNYM